MTESHAALELVPIYRAEQIALTKRSCVKMRISVKPAEGGGGHAG
jgi:hypothetical protein